jgi:DNA-directed RNA polymerase
MVKVTPPFVLVAMAYSLRRFNPESDMPLELPSSVHPTTLLKSIIDRQIPISHVVSDRVFSSSRQAVDIIKLLSKAAVDLNLTPVVNELGQTEALGREYVDPLENVPEVLPVLRIKASWNLHPYDRTLSLVLQKENDVEAQKGADATTNGTDVEVPFNLNNLRKHLAQVAFARRVLPEDVAARQKLLEESVYDVAVERLRHQSEIFESLGLDNQGLRQVVLQRWMWDWHEKLLPRLEAEIKQIVKEEESYRG